MRTIAAISFIFIAILSASPVQAQFGYISAMRERQRYEVCTGSRRPRCFTTTSRALVMWYRTRRGR